MQTEPLQPFCSCVITAHGGQKVLQQHPGGARPVILYVSEDNSGVVRATKALR